MGLLFHIGRYTSFILKSLGKPEKFSLYTKNFFIETWKLGLGSLGIVFIISFFMGAVVTLQTAYNFENPLIPLYLIGLTARDSMLLEFSSTIVALILAGKVGSNIASEIGTMRVSEQIDALEIMGINPASFLVRPKMLGMMFIIPFLTVISMFVGIAGGFIASVSAGVLSAHDYIYGIHYAFIPWYIYYSLIKSVVFAFIYTTVPAYFGYYVSGGALEVGRASTQAVVTSSILILIFNLVLTQLLLA
ncbi:MAG: ABC transporter permease [Salinivirgaceae bacterium]|jgi:phospholipid/cholesterol/gamma-HCH transport system permease protein|nr:ABC transporter permease [Salinivirgaceae bacterium]